jgi:hypothetical protein
MKSKLYIETSVIGYLTARMSRDLITAAHPQLPQDWWMNRRADFELFVSQLVVREISAGDPLAAQKRLQAIDSIPLLALTQEALDLADELVNKGPLPQKASEDALHIALAAVHGMDYLLTWNCKHCQRRNAEICRSHLPYSRLRAANHLHAGRTNGRLKNMWPDEIVEEIHKIREEHAAKFNYDLQAIYFDLKEQEQQSNRQIVSFEPKEPVPLAEASRESEEPVPLAKAS